MKKRDSSLLLDDARLFVWRQALLERAKQVAPGAETFPVRQAGKRRLAQVDFEFEEDTYRGMEQIPDTESR